MSEYAVAAGTSEATLRDRGSRFLAYAAPAADADAAKAFVDAITSRHPDATHVGYAWRVGWPPAERAADAGEPSGTTGPPILAALRAAGLSDTVVAVARWFGGTKLGKGGLVRAYGGAAREAIAALPTRRERPRVRLVVDCPHERVGAVRRLLRPNEIELAAERYGARAELTLVVAVDAREALEAALADLRLAARPASK